MAKYDSSWKREGAICKPPVNIAKPRLTQLYVTAVAFDIIPE